MNKKSVYKLHPAFKDYIWGGTKLREKYGKRTDVSPLAESWELSFHKDGLCKISDGRTLAAAVTADDIGTRAEKFPYFPVLIKFIDARSDLSVQVHPTDEYALQNEGSYGKTEMWYVMEADEGAGIYLGFKKDVTEEIFKKAIEEKQLCELLNFYPVNPGESYFIPSGTIHAIGKGCLICEIQQNSNLTYRVYDYGRRDKFGNERELHIEKALAVTSFSRFEAKPKKSGILGSCEYFTVTKQDIKGSFETSADTESYNAVTCTEGSGVIDGEKIKAGDSFFVPAGYGSYRIVGNLEVLITKT